MLQDQIERRALDRAVHNAQVIGNLGVRSSLDRGDLRYPISLKRLKQLDRQVGKRYFAETGVLRVKLFNRGLRLVYSDDRTLTGSYAVKGGNVTKALGGRSVQELETGMSHDGDGPRTLEVYVPINVDDAGPADGVLEVYMSYEPVAAEIREDVLIVSILLGGGLLILFATLFRIVAGASRRLRHQALHDALTGLPNRTLLHRRAERALRGDTAGAMLLIDLDRFKEVNDTLGHDHGDELLVEVAGRLRGALRRGDTLARLGGDEFAVLLDGLPHRGAAVELAARLQDALRRPFALRGVSIELEASIGVALYPDHGDHRQGAAPARRRRDVRRQARRPRHRDLRGRARPLLGRPPRPAGRAAPRRSPRASWSCTTSRRWRWAPTR